MRPQALGIWPSIGGAVGAAAGLLDGLFATATEPSRVEIWRTLALSIGSLTAFGALAAPLAAKAIGLPRADPRPPLGRQASLLAVGALWALGMGFLGRVGVAALAPTLGYVALPLAVWGCVGLASVLAARLVRWGGAGAGSALLLLALAALLAAGAGAAARLADRPQPLPVPAGSAATAPSVPNVVLVVLDTTRADRLSLYGNPRPTSPALDAFARDAAVYEQAISPAPWTVPAHASLFSGLAPATHGATNEQELLRPEIETLAELLSARGFATAAVSCNANVSRGLGFEQGFEEFHEVFREVLGGRAIDQTLAGRGLRVLRRMTPLGSEKGAARAVALATRWLDHRPVERPFFLFVNLIEPHLPYDPPRAERNRFVRQPLRPAVRALMRRGWYQEMYRRIGRGDLSAQDYAQLAQLYEASLAYQDARLGELLAGLESRGLLANTLVAIVADHGENLGEHGLLNHVFSVHETLLHVPLVVRLPGRFTAGMRYPDPVSTGALFATILEETGTKPGAVPPAYAPLPRAPGARPPEMVASEYELPVIDLANLERQVPGFDLRPFAVRTQVARRGSWKLVRRSPGGSDVYDLARDPGEEYPLSPSAARSGSELERALDVWHARLPPLSHTARSASGPDAETQAALRALGYSE